MSALEIRLGRFLLKLYAKSLFLFLSEWRNKSIPLLSNSVTSCRCVIGQRLVDLEPVISAAPQPAEGRLLRMQVPFSAAWETKSMLWSQMSIYRIKVLFHATDLEKKLYKNKINCVNNAFCLNKLEHRGCARSRTHLYCACPSILSQKANWQGLSYLRFDHFSIAVF